MNVSPSKENILKRIRQALRHSTPLPFPNSEGNSSVFQPSRQELEIEFAEQFTKLQGRFIFCVDHKEAVAVVDEIVKKHSWLKAYCREEKLRSVLRENGFAAFDHPELDTCDLAITSCELLVARTGSIIMTSTQQSGRTTSVYAPVHICIAYTDQLVFDVKDGLQLLKERYNPLPSSITFASGPSRTADIEKTLVVGVHGPAEVFVLLIEAAARSKQIL